MHIFLAADGLPHSHAQNTIEQSFAGHTSQILGKTQGEDDACRGSVGTCPREKPDSGSWWELSDKGCLRSESGRGRSSHRGYVTRNHDKRAFHRCRCRWEE